jgi:hypothetical protein
MRDPSTKEKVERVESKMSIRKHIQQATKHIALLEVRKCSL